MATSTMYSFEQALVSNLQARSNLKNVIVSAGPPSAGQTTTGEYMYVGNASGTQSYKTFGDDYSSSKEESYTYTFYIDVFRAWGQDQSLATERAFELLAELEDEVRLNQNAYRSTNVYLVQAAGPVNLQKVLSADNQWRMTRLIVGVRVTARI